MMDEIDVDISLDGNLVKATEKLSRNLIHYSGKYRLLGSSKCHQDQNTSGLLIVDHSFANTLRSVS